ncbi:hypothetical protein BAE44_0017320 [Dichanthelium oligosanthes]|uniref:Uncharacterized protein n=1 Tax=Dichanthelium oligosanthes TaxID=888268 RepID=A0A1E5V924_9POAL|nr:hypothetical protein BAE44_0017320 [Dichanthelium oligosanthes]
MDMRGNVLRVVEGVDYAKLLRTRLDLVCLDDEAFGTSAVDPETGQVVTISGYVDDRTAERMTNGSGYFLLNGFFAYYSFGRAAPSGVHKAVRLGSSCPRSPRSPR